MPLFRFSHSICNKYCSTAEKTSENNASAEKEFTQEERKELLEKVDKLTEDLSTTKVRF